MSDPSGFTAFVPGFDFIKNLGQQANAWTQPSATGSPPGMPPMAAWVAPTFDVEELDKRINELKSVQFWLEQNARALAATIQAMEVQKMTLSTLKQMDVGMEDAVKAMQANPADLWRAWQTDASGMAGGAAPTPAAPQEDNEKKSAMPDGDPVQWWGALSQQFQDIASNAMKDITAAAAQADQALKASATATAPKGGKKPTAPRKAVAKKPAASKTAARPRAATRAKK